MSAMQTEMTFDGLLREIDACGVELRCVGGNLQCAGLPPERADLRTAMSTHRDRLMRHVRWQGSILDSDTLEPARIRWAHPPYEGDLYAWMPGADTTDVPVGLDRFEP